jgi:hypothetical protein
MTKNRWIELWKVPKISKKKFRSGFEKSIALALTEAGVEFEFETVNIAYVLSHIYIPDFILPNGILVECKGFLRSDDRRKHLAIKDQHPDLDIRFVFMSPNGVVGGAKKLTCAKWADKHGFLWAKRWIPKDWMRENSKDISHVRVADQVMV